MSEKLREVIIAKEELKAIARSANREEMIAKLVGDVYDVELPVDPIIEAIFVTDSVDVGEDYDYLAPEDVDKEVFTLTSNCDVIQVKVTPSSDNALSFTDIISKEYYVCIPDLLKGKHNVLTLKSNAIEESMNRYEIYSVLQLVNAGATAKSNLFELDSGKNKFDFPKLQEMKSALRKFGKKFVLITGSDVTDDIELMDYDSNKQREHSIFKIVDEWFPIEDCVVDVDTVSKPVIGADEAYLVAVSDSMEKKPGYFVRRKLNAIGDASDTEIIAKERAVISTGNMNNVADKRKFSKGIAGFEEVGSVLVNANTVAKFTRS